MLGESCVWTNKNDFRGLPHDMYQNFLPLAFTTLAIFSHQGRGTTLTQVVRFQYVVFNSDSYQRGGGGGEGAGRTSFENHMINYIPFLGTVCGKFTGNCRH